MKRHIALAILYFSSHRMQHKCLQDQTNIVTYYCCISFSSSRNGLVLTLMYDTTNEEIVQEVAMLSSEIARAYMITTTLFSHACARSSQLAHNW